MRKGKIIGYYEHVKVAYFIFLPELHMWQAASWHVRSGCINHVNLHYIMCAGWWKPLMGQTGDWRKKCRSLNWGKEGWGKGRNFSRVQDNFLFPEQMASPPTIRWSQIGLGIQTSSDGLLFHNAVRIEDANTYKLQERKAFNLESITQFLDG